MSQGMIPFLSRCIHERWDSGKPYHLTAIDDLESFIWVTLWAFLYCKEPTCQEMVWLETFTRLSVVLTFKELFLVHSSSEWDKLGTKGVMDNNMLKLFQSLCNVARQGSEFLDKIGLEDVVSPESLADNIWCRSLEQYGAYLLVLYKWLH